MPPRLCSIVLAAHGSTATEHCNDPLHDMAAAILQRQEERSATSPDLWIEKITPAFLQGESQMTEVLESLPEGDVIVIPVMTSDGYYLRKLPEKFASNRNAGKFKFHLSSVFGMHAMIADEMKLLVTHHLSSFHLKPEETTVVVIGHEDPTAENIAAEITTPNTIILPFLISRGPHTTEDVPQAFHLNTGTDQLFPYIHQSDSRFLIYEKPLAMYSNAVDICFDLAIETLNISQPVNLISHGELSL